MEHLNLVELFTAANLIALVSLTALEIVLGIDNIVFIAIVSSKLPVEQQASIRRLGLGLALIERILLLLAISWVAKLTDPLFTVFDKGFSGRDLILLVGGLFLIAKATYEIHGSIEGHGDHKDAASGATKKAIKASNVLIQIAILDTVFSLDSVITAVGMVDHVSIMIIAVVIAVAIMMLFANPVSNFILKHPTVKMLALSFLLMIGVVLVADGMGVHVSKGYIYFAMGFSILVEVFNFKLRRPRAH